MHVTGASQTHYQQRPQPSNPRLSLPADRALAVDSISADRLGGSMQLGPSLNGDVADERERQRVAAQMRVSSMNNVALVSSDVLNTADDATSVAETKFCCIKRRHTANSSQQRITAKPKPAARVTHTK